MRKRKFWFLIFFLILVVCTINCSQLLVFASAKVGLPIISFSDHNITDKLQFEVIKTTQNEIIGTTLADAN